MNFILTNIKNVVYLHHKTGDVLDRSEKTGDILDRSLKNEESLKCDSFFIPTTLKCLTM